MPSAMADGRSQRLVDSGAFFEVSFKEGIVASASG